MNIELQNQYELFINEFRQENAKGRGEVNYDKLVSEPEFTKTEEKQGLISWTFTRNVGDDSLTVDYYCFDRCRVNQIQPDGNRLTVTLKNGNVVSSEVFSWLDER